MVDFKKLNDDPQARERLMDKMEAAREKETARLQGMVDACHEPTQPLTDWEEQFVLSVSGQLTLYGNLSEKQVKVLERIHEEHCS